MPFCEILVYPTLPRSATLCQIYEYLLQMQASAVKGYQNGKRQQLSWGISCEQPSLATEDKQSHNCIRANYPYLIVC